MSDMLRLEVQLYTVGMLMLLACFGVMLAFG